MAAVPPALAASNLFGHFKGAFTGALANREGLFSAAHGGTLFLDEIGKTPPEVQALLLDAVESKSFYALGADRRLCVDVRVLAASNTSLTQLANEGTFLPDLLDRLRALRIVLPPLRDRRADIPPLVWHFVNLRAPVMRYPEVPTVSPELLRALVDAPWPGNVRQLGNVVTQLLADAWGSPTLSRDLLTDAMLDVAPADGPGDPARLDAAMAAANGNKSEAARRLQWSRPKFYRVLGVKNREG